jgi:hypothetical protein
MPREWEVSKRIGIAFSSADASRSKTQPPVVPLIRGTIKCSSPDKGRSGGVMRSVRSCPKGVT